MGYKTPTRRLTVWNNDRYDSNPVYVPGREAPSDGISMGGSVQRRIGVGIPLMAPGGSEAD